MAQKSTAAAAVAVAVAVASFQMVGGKCLIPWRAPPCVGRGRRILLERLKTRKPPTEFQDVCLKTLCAVRARPRLQLEDFNVEGQATWCAWGFSL